MVWKTRALPVPLFTFLFESFFCYIFLHNAYLVTSSIAQRAQRSTVRWLKIDQKELGRDRQGVSACCFSSPGHTTYQHVNTTVNDKPVTVTPPTQDAPEDCLVRPEIIALHLAVTVAEFYPFCTQIHIGLAQPNRVLSWCIQ
jgi:hypothetical protein